jgi:NADH dehydrogenase
MKRVLIIGGGFAGLNAAKVFGRSGKVEVILIDRMNHHLFQPLLYQVATAGLNPSDIAVPIRSILSRYQNITVLQGNVNSVDLKNRKVHTNIGKYNYDYLILACGVQNYYFGHEEWRKHAPGLKNVVDAIEIRRSILSAFEKAERINDPEIQKKLLTFVIVGGGPTGVELAGAIGEMSRFTLARDFRNIDPKLTRILLIEAGSRILTSFSEIHAARATRDLESLGIQVLTSSQVTQIDPDGVEVGKERIQAATVLWAAGVKAVNLNSKLGVGLDAQGRVIVEPDLSLKEYRQVFVAGDQARFSHQTGEPLPALAPVALQQGRCIARNILLDVAGHQRQKFRYVDKGHMATIGRSRAIAEISGLKIKGLFAWIIWTIVHIYYITGFNNRILVVMQWAMSYLSYRRGSRLIY